MARAERWPVPPPGEWTKTQSSRRIPKYRGLTEVHGHIACMPAHARGGADYSPMFGIGIGSLHVKLFAQYSVICIRNVSSACGFSCTLAQPSTVAFASTNDTFRLHGGLHTNCIRHR